MKIPWIFPVAVAGAVNLALCANVADAKELGQTEVRILVKEGQILPLAVLLNMHRDDIQGKLLDIELDDKQGQRTYEIEYIGPDGIVREMYLDAANGQLLRQKIGE